MVTSDEWEILAAICADSWTRMVEFFNIDFQIKIMVLPCECSFIHLHHCLQYSLICVLLKRSVGKGIGRYEGGY